MWAGGRFEFQRPLRLGGSDTRTSRVVSVQPKEGRTGHLVFVIARHEIGNAEGIALIKEQDIVYRDYPKPGDPASAAQPAPKDAEWERVIRPDDVLLFRYSTLTFHAYRIHDDWRYATQAESYPGLVLHGPVVAMLLLDLLRRNMPEPALTRHSFRAMSPPFDAGPFAVCGKPESDRKNISLRARNQARGLATTATATLA